MTWADKLRRVSILVMWGIGAYALTLVIGSTLINYYILPAELEHYRWIVLSSPFDFVAFGLFIVAWLFVGFTPKNRKDAE